MSNQRGEEMTQITVSFWLLASQSAIPHSAFRNQAGGW